MAELNLKVLNKPEELLFFPLTGSVILESSIQVEDSLISDNIVLLRETTDFGLLNYSDLYNHNIGYIKEKYDTVPIDIKLFEDNNKFYINITPKNPLNTASKYLLYIDKDLSSEFIVLQKTISKGPSQLLLVSSENNTLNLNQNSHKLKVISSPMITATSNIVKFQHYVNDIAKTVYTIDAKTTKNKIVFENVTLEVLDKPFAVGEEFTIVSESPKISLPDSYAIKIVTVTSKNIKPVENVNISHQVTNEDVLNFYNQTATVTNNSINFNDKNWQASEINIEYVDQDAFILHLNLLTADQLDLDKISLRDFPAFNKYDLSQIKLYNPLKKYTLTHDILDDKTILFRFIEEVGYGF